MIERERERERERCYQAASAILKSLFSCPSFTTTIDLRGLSVFIRWAWTNHRTVRYSSQGHPTDALTMTNSDFKP